MFRFVFGFVAALAVVVFFAMGSSSTRLSEIPSSAEWERGDAVAQLLEDAAQRRTAGEFRAAEIQLTRAVTLAPDRAPIWAELADLHREIVLTKAAQGDLLAAGQQLELARHSLDGLRGVALRGSGDPNIVVAAEAAHEAVEQKLQSFVHSAISCRVHLARTHADRAHRSWARTLTFRSPRNNRDEVVRGLRHLREAVELGPWASIEARIEVNEALARLKALIRDDEWADLLARAGFEPKIGGR